MVYKPYLIGGMIEFKPTRAPGVCAVACKAPLPWHLLQPLQAGIMKPAVVNQELTHRQNAATHLSGAQEPKKEKKESAGLSPAETKELEDLKQAIVERKAILKDPWLTLYDAAMGMFSPS